MPRTKYASDTARKDRGEIPAKAFAVLQKGQRRLSKRAVGTNHAKTNGRPEPTNGAPPPPLTRARIESTTCAPLARPMPRDRLTPEEHQALIDAACADTGAAAMPDPMADYTELAPDDYGHTHIDELDPFILVANLEEMNGYPLALPAPILNSRTHSRT